MLTKFTEKDEALSAWLSAISPLVCQSSAFCSVLLTIQGQFITVQCTHPYMARRIRDYEEILLQKTGYGIKILVGENQYAFIPPKQPMNNIVYENATLDNSQWARMNSAVIELMSDDGTVSIHSTDRDGGYKVLTIAPYQRIDAVLCLPKEQLIGKAVVDVWDKTRKETEVIAVTKRKVIEDAIASGNKTTHTYQMRWNGLLWEKSITGVLVDDGEVLCITRNLQDYQRKFWENWVR